MKPEYSIIIGTVLGPLSSKWRKWTCKSTEFAGIFIYQPNDHD